MGSRISWCFYIFDLFADILYFLTVSMINDFLQNVMLISLILPIIVNFSWLSWKIGMKYGW